MPSSVEVGQTGVAGSVTVAAAGAPEAGQVPVVSSPAGRYIGICATGAPADSGCSTIGAPWSYGVTLTPSCAQPGAPTTTVPLCQTADPGIFKVATTAAGAAGTLCEGVVFDVVVVDAARGTVKFEPRPAGSFVTLGTTGTACRINFTFDVLKTPIDSAAGTSGIQTRSLATAGGWYFADDKKKIGPLKAVGTSTTTVTTKTCPGGGTPPCSTPTPTPTPTPTIPIQTTTPTPTPTPTITPTPTPTIPVQTTTPTPTPTIPVQTPTPTCTPSGPGVPPPPGCGPTPTPTATAPPEGLVSARVEGPKRCLDTGWSIPVTVDTDASNVRAVEFIRGGRVVKTLRQPNGNGLGTYVLSGSAKALTAGTVKFRVRVRLQNNATFVRGRLVQALTLKDVIRFTVARDCRPTKATFSVKCTGAGGSSLFGAVVTGIRDPRKIKAVSFTLNGRKAKTLKRATNGNRWAFNGPVVRLGNRKGKFGALVSLKGGSFQRGKMVKSKSFAGTLKPSQACKQDPLPPPGG